MLICRRKGALKKNTYFRIGDLSKLFHVGVDSIRYYEKVGLLHPVRNPENGYRQYTLDDIRTMNTIRELLDLGFSTEEILKFEKDRNLSHMQVMLEKEADVIDQKIAELEKTKNEIRGRLHAIRRNLELDCSGEVSELELPERQCLMIRNADMPDNMINYEVAKFTQTMKEKIATIGACDCYTLDIHSFNDTGDDFRTKNVFFYSDYLHFECNYTLPAGTYLSVCYRGGFEKSKMLVPKMLRYAEKHHMVVMGDPMEFCHIDRFETNVKDEYLTELQLPVYQEDSRYGKPSQP